MNEPSNQAGIPPKAKETIGLPAGPPFPTPNLLPRPQLRPWSPRPNSTVSLPFLPKGAGTRGQCRRPASPGAEPTGRAGPDRGTTIGAAVWLAQVSEPGTASVGGGLAPARPALAVSRARGCLRGRSPRPTDGRASTRRPVPFRPQVPAGSGP